MPASWHLCTTEPGADLKGLRSGDREHSMAERSFEFVKDRLTETRGHVAYYTSDGAANRV